MIKGLSRLRIAAVWTLGGLVNLAMVVSFTESYHGLYLWATGHKVTGLFGYAWPLMVDAFLLSGEIVLLTSAIGAWPRKTRLLGWTMSLGGLTASVLANAGQVGAHASISDHVTAAVPPVAAMASMVAAISIIKQTVSVASVPDDVPAVVVAPPQPVRADVVELGTLPTHAAKVRAAVVDLGVSANPQEIYAWLTARDQDVPMSSINSTLSRDRAKTPPTEAGTSNGLADAAIAAEPVSSASIPAGQRRLSRV